MILLNLLLLIIIFSWSYLFHLNLSYWSFKKSLFIRCLSHQSVYTFEIIHHFNIFILNKFEGNIFCLKLWSFWKIEILLLISCNMREFLCWKNRKLYLVCTMIFIHAGVKDVDHDLLHIIWLKISLKRVIKIL